MEFKLFLFGGKYTKFGGPNYRIFQTDSQWWFFGESIRNSGWVEKTGRPGFGGLACSIYSYYPLVASLFHENIPILETVQGYNIPFTVQSEQLKASRAAVMSQAETDFIDQ